VTPARYFLLRRVRFGPLVPARLMEIAHEPGEPSNPRDRWPATIVCADIAGEVVPPEELTDRFFWSKHHWKWAEPVDEATYRYHFERLRRAETADPQNPVLRSRKRVDPAAVPLPSFERENQL
jgi:hypothetical protein